MPSADPRPVRAEGNPLTIVDAQVHLWAADEGSTRWPDQGRRYAGAAPIRSSAERASFLDSDLLPEMDRAGVDRALIVPPVFAGDSNAPALEAARRHPDRLAVMGRLALRDPASKGLLPGWLDDPVMAGIRLTFFWDEHKKWLRDGEADWFWPIAERLGIPVAVLAPGQNRKIADVARRHPDLRIIVDHFGMTLGNKDEAAIREIDELLPLAGLPNVAVKASTLPSYVSDPYPFLSLYRPIERVVEAFGPRRVFWGSEMTRLPCSYGEAVTHFTEHLDFLSPDDLSWIMGRGVLEWVGLR